jgi:hypothetical protein
MLLFVNQSCCCASFNHAIANTVWIIQSCWCAGLCFVQAKLLEHNVRFGDPECQGLMARLDSDLVEALVKVCVGVCGGDGGGGGGPARGGREGEETKGMHCHAG